MTLNFAGLLDLIGLGQDFAVAALFVFLRIGAAMALIPAFGENSVPQRLRLFIALAFTAVVAPAAMPLMPKDPGLMATAVEIVAGLALGAAFRLFILALQTAGAMIAQATSLSQITAGAPPEPQPAVGHLLTAAGLALAVMAGLHVKVAAVLILSYSILPAGAFPNASDITEWGVWQIAQAFSLAFSLAAPFTIAALMYNLALGGINRAMPALMVSFIGAPALSAAGLVLLALLSPLLLGVWTGALAGFLDSPFEVQN
ncbi:MAG: flagellar biosynthetic protein FliR [Rhodobacteraceae bacterium]|nr:flagellar biosynthetic protein FliR [Paracoccaceae bacterium]